MTKVTRKNILIPVGRSCHKKCSCADESSNIYHLEDMYQLQQNRSNANVKSFGTNSLALAVQNL